MHNFRHFYYQNKEKIWKVVLIIAFVLGIIYFLNGTVTERNNSESRYEKTPEEYYYSESEKVYISGTSAVTGGAISESEAEKINDTISQFLQYCQNNKSSEAYNMLSEDCKQDRYSTLEKFTNQYVNKKFNNVQTYNVQRWRANTYKVEISEDILVTGNANNSEKQVEYITIINQNNENKLNISGFVERKTINAERTEHNVRIKVIEKHSHMEYEEYKFEIENLSNKTIKLDSLENTGTIYLKDGNGNKYYARMHEILDEEMIISPKHTFELTIRFTNTYSTSKTISSVTFENLILDYNTYKKQEDKENFEDIYKFTVNL